MDQGGTWHGGGPWSRPHCARWGPSSPPQKVGIAPQFSAHLYCGQTAGRIKVRATYEVGLNPGDLVLDGDPAPTPKGAEPHHFTTQCAAKATEFGEITQNKGHYADQGHSSWPPILVPIQSSSQLPISD